MLSVVEVHLHQHRESISPVKITSSGGQNAQPRNVETALHARSMKAKLSPFVEVIIAVGTCLVLWYGARRRLPAN